MKYVINGGNKLNGEINVYSAKNSVLVLMAASLLCKGTTVLTNCENIADVKNMTEILRYLGAKVFWHGNNIVIDATEVVDREIPEEYCNKLRGSVFVLGALLGRNKKAVGYLPGGCNIGKRPIDIHIDGLRALGVKVETDGKISCDGTCAKGGTVKLRFPSVGATENILMASVLCKGKTTLINCALEPEVTCLAKCLNQMGAKISGIGSKVLTVTGTDSLHGVCFSPVPDRIVAGTYLIATAMCGGVVKVGRCNPRHLSALIGLLKKSGCHVKCGASEITVCSSGKTKGFGLVRTAPYPAFPTDLQSLILSASCVADGKTVIEENLFENRLTHNVEMLRKMGAVIGLEKNVATVEGGKLGGAVVQCADLRGGAGLILAGLVAKGQTVVEDGFHVQRGYCQLAKALSSLGADVVETE